MKKRRVNQILGIEDTHGVWHENDEEICATAIAYFADLFQSCRPNQIEEIESCMEGRITREDNTALTAPVSDGEIMEAVFQIPPMRSLGPDGFTSCFYQDH